MTTSATQPDQAPSIAASVAPDALPVVSTSLSPEQIVDTLERAARRGRLPEFSARGGGLFEVAAFGRGFDKRLIAQADRADGEAGSTVLRFRMRWMLRAPIITAVVLIATVEPGRYFVDHLVPARWGWIDTRLWYYPLTVIPLPWIWWRLTKASAAAAHKHALEMITRIAEDLGGCPVSPRERTL